MIWTALVAALAALILSAPCRAQTDENHHALADMPRGLYKSDNLHTDIYFTYSHVGFTNAHARFDKFAGELNYDPQYPEKSPVTIAVDAGTIDTNVPELDRVLKGKTLLQCAALSGNEVCQQTTSPNLADNRRSRW